MYIVWGNWLMTENHSMSTIAKITSVFRNHTVTSIQTTDQSLFYDYWYRNVTKGHYWTASLIVPIGTLLVLAILILLMVLFKRCPLLVTTMVATILGVIVIFVIYVTANNSPVYL